MRYAERNSFGPIVVYNCTKRCNLRCMHCYSASGSAKGDDELTTSQAKEMLAEAAQINCPVVLFSGGEPLLREDLFELLAEARRLKLRTVISTNGTLIDAAVAGKLAEAGVGYVGISIDGGEEFHDKFRGVKGSFAATAAGIENCKKAGLKTGLRFTITKANAEQVPYVFDFAASAGVRRICFYHLIRTGRAMNAAQNQGASEGMCYVPGIDRTRKIVNVIIEKTDYGVRNHFLDEVLTVGNHCDGPYLLTKMVKEKNPAYESAKRLPAY